MSKSQYDIENEEFDAWKESIDKVEVAPPDFVFDNVIEELKEEPAAADTKKSKLIYIVIGILLLIALGIWTSTSKKENDIKGQEKSSVERRENIEAVKPDSLKGKAQPPELDKKEPLLLKGEIINKTNSVEPIEERDQIIPVASKDTLTPTSPEVETLSAPQLKEEEGKEIVEENKEAIKEEEEFFLGIDPNKLTDSTRTIFKSKKELKKSKEKKK